jgi:hypothetical protein
MAVPCYYNGEKCSTAVLQVPVGFPSVLETNSDHLGTHNKKRITEKIKMRSVSINMFTKIIKN